MAQKYKTLKLLENEDKYFEALDFINHNKYDIISPSKNAKKIKVI